MNKTVLIIDHTKRFTTSVAEHLHNRGYNVLSAQNRATAFRLYRKVRPNIVLIHEEFPNIDLVRIINIIHAKDDHIPIMLIVTDFEAANAISAFYRNVSDCITIDINPSDLALRIQRCLTTLAPGKPKIPLGQSLYLPEDFYILCDTGTYIDLIPKENELLFLFCSKLGETCTSEELIKVLWGQKDIEKKQPPDYWQMNLGTLIYSLRKKMRPLNYIRIANISRIGYRMYLSNNA